MTGKRRLYVRHVYEGKGDLYAVRNFYVERMPQHGWQIVYAGQIKGTHEVRFEKGQESCTITIAGSGSSLGRGVEVQLIIRQEERGTQAPGR